LNLSTGAVDVCIEIVEKNILQPNHDRICEVSNLEAHVFSSSI